VIPISPQPICRAACLGGCSQDDSREHLLTASTLRGPELGVRGLPFLNGETIRIHKDHFKSNILCRSHNNALSPVDEAGTVAFELLRKAEGGGLGYTLNGSLLERWFLKTLINFEVAASFSVRPPLDIVEIAFGHRQFGGKSGLFHVSQAEPLSDGQVEIDERVSYTRLQSTPDKITGGRFEFHCLRFVLMLSNFPFPDMEEVGHDGVSRRVSLQRHPKKLALRSSNSVHVNW
jgi:hypothetical protein